MTDLKMDMAKIQTLVGNAFSATGALVARFGRRCDERAEASADAGKNSC